MLEEIPSIVIAIGSGLASGIFMSGVTIGVFKKTLNGSVAAIHRIDERQEKFTKKLDDHIAEEAMNQARIGRIEGILHAQSNPIHHRMESL